MNSLNSIMVEGNLVRDPELRFTSKGTPIAAFSIASNRWYGYEGELRKETSFFDVEAWARTAERVAENCLKGRGVRIVGRLKQDRWVTTEGESRSKVKVVAEHVEIKPIFNRGDKEEKAEDEKSEDKKLAEELASMPEL